MNSLLSSNMGRMGETGGGSWYSGIYKAFIYASVILFIIYFFTSGSSSYYSLITGLSTFILGISMIIILIMNSIIAINASNNKFSSFSFNNIGTLLYKTGPLFLILGLIGFLLYLCFQYKSPILSGHVSSGYYTFMNISICLMLSQLYLILSSPQTTDKIHIHKITAGILYLINLITLVCALTINSILKYFTTDGFHTN